MQPGVGVVVAGVAGVAATVSTGSDPVKVERSELQPAETSPNNTTSMNVTELFRYKGITLFLCRERDRRVTTQVESLQP